MNKIFLLCIASFLFASGVEVSVVTPKQSSDAMTIEADGVVLSQEIALSAKTSGLVYFYVNENVDVKKGELIAKVVDKRRQLRLDSLKERLNYSDKELKLEQEKLQEVQEKYKMGISAKNEYLNEKIILEQLKETRKTIYSEYEIVKLEENESLLRAQKDGYITRLVQKNRFVNYGDSLGVLIPKDVVIKLFVDAQYANSIYKGMRVDLQSSYGKMKGTVYATPAQTSNNLLEVMVVPDSNLPLNLQLKADISVKNLNGLKIPKSAIALVDNQPAVYEIKESMAYLQFVKILSDRIDFVLIKNTLPNNAKIALQNAYMLHDNLEVTVK